MGLVPAIHVLLAEVLQKDADARDERGHDAGEVVRFHRNALYLHLTGIRSDSFGAALSGLRHFFSRSHRV